jgi:ubiquinone biosynthesis monooxygenase Coq7
LRAHLKSLPGEDRKSQLILQQMLADEERHGEEALALGGQEFTRPIKDVMTVASQVMTRTTYWI